MKESFSTPSAQPEDNEKKRSLANKAGLGAAALAAGVGAFNPDAAEAQNTNADDHSYEAQAESGSIPGLDDIEGNPIDLNRDAGDMSEKELANAINTSHELGTIVRGGTPLVTPDMDRQLLEMMYSTMQEFGKTMFNE